MRLVIAILLIANLCVGAYAYRMRSLRVAAECDLADAMIEVERLEARAALLHEIVHELRTGRID